MDKIQKIRKEVERIQLYSQSGVVRLKQILDYIDKVEKEPDDIWKPADGDDLPEIGREVIAILNNDKVVFAHRPNPEGWDGKSLSTGKVEHYMPQCYDKGGWNIPNVKYWLDTALPNMED